MKSALLNPEQQKTYKLLCNYSKEAFALYGALTERTSFFRTDLRMLRLCELEAKASRAIAMHKSAARLLTELRKKKSVTEADGKICFAYPNGKSRKTVRQLIGVWNRLARTNRRLFVLQCDIHALQLLTTEKEKN